MCGELRLEGESRKIRSIILAKHLETNPFNQIGYEWNGFARIDGSVSGTKTMAQQWPRSEWKITVVKIKGFVEKKKNFNFDRTVRVGAVVNKNGDLKLLTRASKTKIEKSVHHRMPSMYFRICTLAYYKNTLLVWYI